MDPKIMQKEAMVIAGVAGSGDETGKAWEAFMEIKLNWEKRQLRDLTSAGLSFIYRIGIIAKPFDTIQAHPTSLQ